MLLIFEGMDRVGKTTLMNKITQLTDYKFPMMDRGPAGFMTYDTIFDRVTAERKLSYFKDAESLNQMDVLYIYLHASGKELLRRLKKEGKPLAYSTDKEMILHICDTEEIYENMIYSMYHPGKVLVLDTTSTPVEELVTKVLLEIDRRKQYWPLDLNLLGEECSTKTRIYYPSHNVLPQEVLEVLPDFNVSIDEPYYSMVLSQLDHSMYKFKKGLVNERNIFVTSGDCICFAQIILSDPKKFIINVNQRSFNIEKHTYNDLAVFYFWFLNSEMTTEYHDRKLVINYDIGCPHIIPSEEVK
jgi:deoxyadenosine/deoxycytidine kinase